MLAYFDRQRPVLVSLGLVIGLLALAAVPAAAQSVTETTATAVGEGSASPRALTYMLWDVAPLGIDNSTAHLLRQMLEGELSKLLGPQLDLTPDGLTDEVRAMVAQCGGTPACLAEAGGALGAHRVIVGVTGTLGDAYSMNLKVIDTSTGEVAAKAQASLIGSRDKMLDAMQKMVFELVDPSVLTGALAVDIAHDGASVYVDGKQVGTTPMSAPVTGLAAGEHALKVTSPVMKDYFTFFTVQPGKTTWVRVAPEEIAALEAKLEAAQSAIEVPLYKRWWFWAIVGGTAAAVAGGTIYAVSATNGGGGPPNTTLGTVDLSGGQ